MSGGKTERKFDKTDAKNEASLDVKDRAMYSAWHVDRATQVWRLEDQDIGVPHPKELKP
jgi:hypothetical protein